MQAHYVTNTTLPYVWYGDNTKPHRTILFLHGRSQRGQDLNQVEVHSLPKEALNNDALTLHGDPVVIIAPQIPKGGWGWRAQKLFAILSKFTNTIGLPHLTGVSLGGIGTMEIMNAYPNSFESFGSVCGWFPKVTEADDLNKFRGLKVLNWHGDADGTVGIGANYQRAGLVNSHLDYLAFRMKIFPGADHAIWGKVYNGGQESLYFKWLHEEQVSSFYVGYQVAKDNALTLVSGM